MKIAIIGCGKQAPKHISGLLNASAVDEIFVADLFPAQSEALAGKYESNVKTMSIDDVFTRDEIDGVVIATPTPAHHDLCKRAILSGKPFLVEKPLASTYEQAEELLTLSNEKSVPGMVGFIYRFAPVFGEINTLLAGNDDNVLGAPKHALFRIAGRGSDQAWKHSAEKQGGAISEMMVHMIDLAVWYFGAAKDIKLVDNALVHPQRMIRGETIDCDAEDWSVASLVMENGTRVLIQADMISPVFRQFIEVNGDNGLVEGSIQNTFQDAVTLFEERGDFEKGRQLLKVEPGNFYINQLACFLDMVESKSQPANCTLGDAVEVMRIQAELKNQAAL